MKSPTRRKSRNTPRASSQSRAPKKLRIAFASDHAGVELKAALISTLSSSDELLELGLSDYCQGDGDSSTIQCLDLGPTRPDRVDYPDYAKKVAQAVLKKKADLGVLICGSGIGMSISANKFPGIRAALVENPLSARLAKEHNHANILCLGARFVAPPYAASILAAWLSAHFDPQSRHQDRIKKIAALERLF